MSTIQLAVSAGVCATMICAGLLAALPTTSPSLGDLPPWVPSDKIAAAGCNGAAVPPPPKVALAPDAVIHRVSTPQEIQAALANPQPGDVIEIAPGTYRDLRLAIGPAARATAEKPIILRGTDVVLTGASHILVEGQFIVVQGLTFENATHKWGPPGSFYGVCIQLGGSNNRVTQCRFSNCGEAVTGWRHIVHVPNTGRHNRVDSCTFLNSQCIPTGLQDGVGPEGIVFSHNYIDGNNAKVEKNWRVGIQIGQGRHDETGTIVEYNTIRNMDGPESIGIKGSRCIVRNNLVLDSEASLGVRAGNDCVIRDNVMLHCVSGIMLTGRRHLVEGNCVIADRKEGGCSPIFLHCEADKDGKQFYMPTTHCTIRGNILAVLPPNPFTPVVSDFCWLPDMKALPAENTFDGNLLIGYRNAQLIGCWDQSKKSTVDDFVRANTWTNNRFWLVDAKSPADVKPAGDLLGHNGNRVEAPKP